MANEMHGEGEAIEALVKGLTKAQRRAVLEGHGGYYDDNSLRGSERAMFYRLIERDIFGRPFGVMAGGNRPDIVLTSLGLAVRAHLKSNGGK